VVEIELACRFQRSQSKAWLERTPPGGPAAAPASRRLAFWHRSTYSIGRPFELL